MNLLLQKIRSQFTSENERTSLVKKNIFFSMLLSGVNILSGLLLVPVSLEILGQEQYGVWLTIASLMMWLDFFDVGIGNGLRNKLGIAIANQENALARKYVSTTYASVFFISIFIFLLAVLLSGSVSWGRLLNTTAASPNELSFLFLFLIGFFSLKLLLRLITSILFAFQMSAWCDFINTAGKLTNLLLLILLSKIGTTGLVSVGLVFGFSSVVFHLIFSLFFFKGKFAFISPSFKHVDFSLLKSLMGLGGKFFILQLSVVLLYSSNNFIISHLFSPAEVAPYYVSQSYFGVITMFFTIIVQPFWSASTDAMARQDQLWIRRAVQKLLLIWVVILTGICIMVLLSSTVYKIWLKGELIVPIKLTLWMAIFTAVQTLSAVFVNFINGSGKIFVQMVYSIVGAFVNILCSFLLVRKFNLGPEAITISLVIYQSVGLAVVYYQFRKILSGTISGIWEW